MRHAILILSSSLLLSVSHTQAQDIQKQDSLLTKWANDQARYSRLTCAEVERRLLDSAAKIIAPIATRDAPVRAENGELVSPMDSVGVEFLTRQRIRKELLR